MAESSTEDKKFLEKIEAFGQWRERLVVSIKGFQSWLETTGLDDSEQSLKIYEILQALRHDRLILAFVGEFSRGKTELINSIFFSKYKKRLLPSEAGRTTMCPTEIFFDEDNPKPYLKLLPIESRLESTSLSEHRKELNKWVHINLNDSSSESLIESFAQITDRKTVSVTEAIRLGLDDATYDDEGNSKPKDAQVEIPAWRQALINFPHPFLQQGLTILDTPGLNSLGNEPELTLSMLPKAQAVVFVLGADTGVTRSDMDIWQESLRSFRRKRTKSGLIVALNKIDSLWDALKTEAEISAVIKSQRANTAKTLVIDESQVIGVSAQKALLARVKSDNDLLVKSNILEIEKILAQDIIPQKEQLVKNTLLSDLKEIMVNDKNIILEKFKSVKSHVDELSSSRGKNEDIVKQLLEKTRLEQGNYKKNMDIMSDSRKKIDNQFKQLVNIISLDKLDQLVSTTRDSMKGSWTTPGIKEAMKIFFEGIQTITDESGKQVDLTNRLIGSVYKRFSDESGYNLLNAPSFQISKHIDEVEKLHKEADEYRTSAKTTMTEQSFVIKNFFITLVSQARNIFFIFNQEVHEWQKSTLSPLAKQLKSQKNEVNKRVEELKQISESKQSIDVQVKKTKQEALLYFTQVKEIDGLIAVMEGKKAK